MMAVEVVINCKSHNEIHPELLDGLKSQSLKHNLQIFESSHFPTRLRHVQNPESLYVFLDQDVVLPHVDFLKRISEYCNDQTGHFFFTGAYLSHPESTYLVRCYNSQVNSWILAEDVHNNPSTCENAPGGIWIVSGKILPQISDWIEPKFWAGEDTFTVRWLQSRGLNVHYTPLADVYHYPKCDWFYFLKRAFKQGIARRQYNLTSRNRKLNWKFHLRNSQYWPGWTLHQLFVILGSIKSLMAKNNP